MSNDFIRPERRTHIRPSGYPGLVYATKETITIQVVILFYVRLENLRVSSWFGTVKGLDIILLLGTSFIYHFVEGIFPQDKKRLPIRSTSVAIHEYVTEASPVSTLTSNAKE